MTDTAPARRSPGRPRSEQADAAILAAAIDLFLDCGAGQTSIEQVAQRAGVTRATVYRRFPDKTALLVEAIGAAQAEPPGVLDWTGVDDMLTDWAAHLSEPRNRRLLRRLYGAVDDYPELLLAYRNVDGARRASAVHTALTRAQAAGELPPDVDLEILEGMLNGAILHHLGTRPDDGGARDVKEYLAGVLRQVGYRPA